MLVRTNYFKSLKENRYGIILMLVASVLIAFGQLFWKLSQGTIGGDLLAGFVLYGIGALVMTVALHFGKLSVVHPLLCFSYVAGLFLSNFFLSEKLSLYQYVGIVTIMTGVVTISIGDRQ